MERLYESMDDDEVEEIVTAVIKYLDEKNLLATADEENGEEVEEVRTALEQLAKTKSMDVDELKSPVRGAAGREFY